MNLRIAALAILMLFTAGLVAVVVAPHVDLAVSGYFYQADNGFYMADRPVFVFLHHFAIKGAWYGGYLFTIMTVLALLLRRPVLLPWKSWLFLLLALFIGPALIANAGFKDHWGRARPRDVTEFSGTKNFTPALFPQEDDEGGNGSFVSGDGAFGAFLHSFAYLPPLPARRRRSIGLFWGLVSVGGTFGLARIAMGAHFFSDVLFATLFMFLSSAAIHASLYGWRSTRDYWRAWLGLKAS